MKHSITKVVLALPMYIAIKKIVGLENIPQNTSFIVASNHASYLDDFIVPYQFIAHTNRKLNIFVNSRYYKSYFLRKFFNNYGCIPVDVRKDNKDKKTREHNNKFAIEKAIKNLKNGHIAIIFPEGGRSDDGKLKKAKLGVAKLTLATGLPVLPVAVKGTFQMLPKGRMIPRLKRCSLKIGKPLHFDSLNGNKSSRKSLEMITRKVMKEIAVLADTRYDY